MKNRWIRRKRNSLGFGVQSPNDFYFVQHVLREQSAYYGYSDLHKLIQSASTDAPIYPETIYRLLFRLANFVHPSVIVEAGTGSGLSACAMILGHPMGRCITLDKSTKAIDDIGTFPQVTIESGDEIALFDRIIEEIGTIEMLHIAHTEHYATIVEHALPHVCNKSLFIIEGIHDNPEKRLWWKQLRESPYTGVSYDLSTTGLLFFDKTRYKDSYWIDLKY